MSEPARSLPPHEAGSRPAPGPLRDWLAAMKAHAAPQTAVPAPSELRAEAHEDRQGARPEFREPLKPTAAEAGWTPRLVQPAQVPQAGQAPQVGQGEPEDEDVSQLMAENLMLKAKLRLEGERQGELQALVAEQIRELRAHIAEEMGSLQDLRAEQDAVRAERDEFRMERERFREERATLRSERDRAWAEREAFRTEREALAAERDILREERDLWRARTEALAQPLFQGQKR